MFLDEYPDILHSLNDRKAEVIVIGDNDSEVCKLKSLLND